MVIIEDIELIIRKLIETNEKIVSNYDSKLLCSDYENTKSVLKDLNAQKQELIKNLEHSLNDFFKINQNFITRKLKTTSFKLIPNLMTFEYKFNLPKTVDSSSREYFCYLNMMDCLSREYDVINFKCDGYYILDIAATLNLTDNR